MSSPEHGQDRACGHGSIRDHEQRLGVVVPENTDDPLDHLDHPARSVENHGQSLSAFLPSLDGDLDQVVQSRVDRR